MKLILALLPIFVLFSRLVDALFSGNDITGGRGYDTLAFLVSMALLSVSIYFLVNIFRNRNSSEIAHTNRSAFGRARWNIAVAMLPAIFISSILQDALSLLPNADLLIVKIAIDCVGYMVTCMLFVYISRLRSNGEGAISS